MARRIAGRPFLVAAAVTGLFLLVAGTARFCWWPTAHRKSERIVRDFVAEASRTAGDFRRDVQRIMAHPKGGAGSARAAVAARESQALRAIDEAAAEAKRRIDAMDKDLDWRALRNRLRRIERRAADTKQYIARQEAKALAGPAPLQQGRDLSIR